MKVLVLLDVVTNCMKTHLNKNFCQFNEVMYPLDLIEYDSTMKYNR